MNAAFRAMLQARAGSTVAASRALQGVTHNLSRGEWREVLASEFLMPLLPPTLGIGSGSIIDHLGGQSAQQDLVIYDRTLVPPALVGSTFSGLFPIDGVLFTIEVKSTLTADELRDADEKARALEKMAYLNVAIPRAVASAPGLLGPTGPVSASGGHAFAGVGGSGAQGPVDHASRLEKAVPCLFAFAADSRNVLDDYLRSEVADPGLRALCVVDLGYWFWKEPQGWQRGWVSEDGMREAWDYAEMLDFASTILARYDQIRATRVRDLNPFISPRE
jgi:hypothetical protein